MKVELTSLTIGFLSERHPEEFPLHPFALQQNGSSENFGSQEDGCSQGSLRLE